MCPTLCDPMDSTVHGILQARILKWVGLSLLKGIFPTQGWNPGLPHCGWILYKLSHKGNKWQIYCLNYVSAWIVTIFAEQHGRPSEHLPVFQVHAPLQDLSRVLCLLFLWRPEHFASPTVTAGSHHMDFKCFLVSFPDGAQLPPGQASGFMPISIQSIQHVTWHLESFPKTLTDYINKCLKG